MTIMASTPYLASAQRQAQLRGMPYNKKTVSDILAGWYNSAGDSITADRQNALVADSITDSNNQAAASLAQQRELSTATLAQQRQIADAQAEAAGAQSSNSMYGNLAQTGLGLGGSYLMMNGVSSVPTAGAAAAQSSGELNGILGDMQAATQPGYAGTLGGSEELLNAGLNSGIEAAGTTGTGEAIGANAVSGATETAGSAAAAETGGASISSVAAPAAYIAAAEIGRQLWGGQDIDWSEKTKQQRTVDSPVTSGMMATILPGSLVAGDGTVLGNSYKNMSALERTAMAPIDYLFGDKDAFNGETLRTAGNALYAPFGDSDSTAAKVANVVVNPLSIITGGGGTWLCTEISARHGIDKDDIKALSVLRRYAIKNRREESEVYFKQGYKLIDVINVLENADDLYCDLKEKLVKATCDLVRKDDLQGAFAKYKEVTEWLCEKYGVTP